MGSAGAGDGHRPSRPAIRSPAPARKSGGERRHLPRTGLPSRPPVPGSGACGSSAGWSHWPRGRRPYRRASCHSRCPGESSRPHAFGCPHPPAEQTARCRRFSRPVQRRPGVAPTPPRHTSPARATDPPSRSSRAGCGYSAVPLAHRPVAEQREGSSRPSFPGGGVCRDCQRSLRPLSGLILAAFWPHSGCPPEGPQSVNPDGPESNSRCGHQIQNYCSSPPGPSPREPPRAHSRDRNRDRDFPG